MNILILETSDTGCIVFAKNATPLASKKIPSGPQLSKNLALEVDAVLKTQDAKPQLIAVGIGPGSYTGIRVGVALAQGLGLGWNVPVLGFCSLQGFPTELPILVDAKSGGLYALIEGKALLLKPDDQQLSLLTAAASPHPEIVNKKFTNTILWTTTAIEPNRLAKVVYAQFLEEGIRPIRLEYLIPTPGNTGLF